MSRKIKSFLVYSLCVIILILWISNPGETSYLSKISIEYAKNHSTQPIPNEVIKRIGSSKRKNYILFSTYAYKYGDMSFFYLGVANKVFYMGSNYEKRKKTPYKVV